MQSVSSRIWTRVAVSISYDNNHYTTCTSTRPLISKSSSSCTNPLLTVPRAPITIGITVTFTFHNFFNSQARLKYLSFNFTLWPDETAKFTILQVLFIFCGWLLKGLDDWPRLGDQFLSQNPRGVCAFHSPGRILCCAYTICSYGQIQISCIVPSGSPTTPSRVKSNILSVLICCYHLSCDRSFRLYRHITYICYFVMYYLFLLWYGWSFWHCFMLLLLLLLLLFIYNYFTIYYYLFLRYIIYYHISFTFYYFKWVSEREREMNVDR